MATRCAGAADDDAGDRISEQSGAERSRPRHSRLPTTEKLPWLRRSAARPRHWRRRRQQQLFRPCSLSAATRSDRKSTRLNSSHLGISYAVFCLKKKKVPIPPRRRGDGRECLNGSGEYSTWETRPNATPS